MVHKYYLLTPEKIKQSKCVRGGGGGGAGRGACKGNYVMDLARGSPMPEHRVKAEVIPM